MNDQTNSCKQIPTKSRASIWNSFKNIHVIDRHREYEYHSQPDHLFPYYLLISLAISFVIILIRFFNAKQDLYSQLTLSSSSIWFEFMIRKSNIICYGAILVSILGIVWCFACSNRSVSFHINLNL